MSACRATSVKLNCGCCETVRLECDVSHDLEHEVHHELRWEEGGPDDPIVYFVSWRRATSEESARAVQEWRDHQ
jgi:hypothetical protein